MRIKLFLIYLQLLFITGISKGFDWEPVTESDWKFQLPDSIRIRHSAILFEKINVNDSKLINNGCIYSLYRRIRIFQNEGRKLADVPVPPLDVNGDIDELEGRVVLKDGTIIELTDDHIFSKYVLESNDDEVEQTFFYLPGVTSDCILEYYIEYELESSYPIWNFEQDIYLKYGELTWEFYKGDDINYQLYNALRKSLVPNYVILNKARELKLEKIMDGDEVEKLKFTAENILPFEEEDYSIISSALKAQLIYFYQDNNYSEEFWNDLSRDLDKELKDDSISDTIISDLVNSIPKSPERQKVIDFAYEWVLKHIINTDFKSDDKDYKANECVDSVISRKYGSSNDINNLFYHILNKLGVKAYTVFCLSRSNNLFRSSAKYWQFDRRITAVKNSKSGFSFYDLSNKNIPKGFVDFDYENTNGLIIGCLPYTDIYIPASEYKSNTILMSDNVSIQKDLCLKGLFKSKFTGHFATKINEELDLLESRNKRISCLFDKNSSVKSVDTVIINERNSNTVSLEGIHSRDNFIFSTGQFLLLLPFNNVNVIEKIKQKEKRIHPLQFDFPYIQKYALQITLPQDIEIYQLPSDSAFKNDIGECFASFTKIDEQLLSVTFSFTLKHSFILQERYSDLAKLFEVRNAILSKVILLNNIKK